MRCGPHGGSLSFPAPPLAALLRDWPRSQKVRQATPYHALVRPQGLSINDGISKDEFSLHYITVDDAVRLMHKHGKGARLAKVDLQNAFRLCPVSLADWSLLGIHWERQYYVDKVLPFGLRSSPFLFKMLADALCLVATHKFGVEDLVHYLDDYLSVQPAKPLASAQNKFFTLLATLEYLNVPLANGPDEVCPHPLV